jgi:hypothetical protein
MSSKELRRKTVPNAVARAGRKLRSAAEVLQISYRQCRSVYQRDRQQGYAGYGRPLPVRNYRSTDWD